MLEKPDLQDEQIIACLQAEYGLRVVEVAFLPLGAGGGQGFAGHTAQEEESLFYRGYGRTQIDLTALAYYRYERIVQDLAVYCEQIFLTDDGSEDRERSLRYLTSNFLPNNTIEIAYKSELTLRVGQLCNEKT